MVAAVGLSSVAKWRWISPFCPACQQAGTETLWKQCHLPGACLFMTWLYQDTKGERSHRCCSLTQLLNTSEGQAKARREGQCSCRGPTFTFPTTLLWKAGISPHLPPGVAGKECHPGQLWPPHWKCLKCTQNLKSILEIRSSRHHLPELPTLFPWVCSDRPLHETLRDIKTILLLTLPKQWLVWKPKFHSNSNFQRYTCWHCLWIVPRFEHVKHFTIYCLQFR